MSRDPLGDMLASTAREARARYWRAQRAGLETRRPTVVGRVVKVARFLGYSPAGGLVYVRSLRREGVPFSDWDGEFPTDGALFPRAAERAALAGSP